MERELINYRQILLPTQSAKITEQPENNGKIKQVEIHWPDGCNSLVQVAVYQQSIRFLPREGYLAMNDTTRMYEFNRTVKQTDELMVEILNGDGAWPHTITATILIEPLGE